MASLRETIDDGKTAPTGARRRWRVSGWLHLALVRHSGSVTMFFIVDMLASIAEPTYPQNIEAFGTRCITFRCQQSLMSGDRSRHRECRRRL